MFPVVSLEKAKGLGVGGYVQSLCCFRDLVSESQRGASKEVRGDVR